MGQLSQELQSENMLVAQEYLRQLGLNGCVMGNEAYEGQASFFFSWADLFLLMLIPWGQTGPGHPQAFLLTVSQHHSGFIHIDE